MLMIVSKLVLFKQLQKIIIFKFMMINNNSLVYSEKIKKEKYMHQLFCWIQNQETPKVIQFFQTYPQFVNKFFSYNNWSPAMYAARYANFTLLKYFVEKGHNLDVPNIYNNTLVHAACYSNEYKMLNYVLNDLQRDPNPLNSEPSPLKYCIKANNSKLLEILVNNGAYYIFDEISNNVEKKQDGTTFLSLITKKQIPSNMIVKDSELKQYPIKQVLRWSRAKSLMYMKKYADSSSNSPKFLPIKRILSNPKYFDSIVKMCIGSGKILINPVMIDAKQTKDAMLIQK